MNNKDHQKYIIDLYADISGYIGYEIEKQDEPLQHLISLTYGEILYEGVNTIINNININEQDIFYDLGSGIGKLVLQFFLSTPIKKAQGIEASLARHQVAANIFNKVTQQLPELFTQNQGQRLLQSAQGNFLLHDILDATIIFIDSVCFSEETLKHISTILNNCPHLKHVISSKALTIKLPLEKKLQLACSWQPTTECYLYSK